VPSVRSSSNESTKIVFLWTVAFDRCFCDPVTIRPKSPVGSGTPIVMKQIDGELARLLLLPIDCST